eukprot:14638794-Ditylum_brightwellii.AAC.1
MVWIEENLEEEMVNNNIDCLATMIHEMIVQFWEGSFDFKFWESGTLAPVPKKGDLSNPNKWCLVCLLETINKVLVSIIAWRINPVIQDHNWEPQCGCLNLKGCQDANFLCWTALQLWHEHNLPTYALFVDLVKAFNSVNHKYLWLVLHKHGISHSVVNVIKPIYSGFKLKFTVEAAIKEILYTIGVHQRDNLAPLLFKFTSYPKNLFFLTAKSGTPHGCLHGHSIQIGKEFSFKKSLYGDDGTFLFETHHDLQKVCFLPPGLDISMFDTSPIPVLDSCVKYTDKFKHLGSYITPDLSDMYDVKNRVVQANKAMASMIPH